MKIAVYCAARETNNNSFDNKTRELGKYLASKNHTLVYGGSKTGLMGIIADSMIEENAKVIGVIPNIKVILERVHQGLSEYYYVETMAERRSKMEEISDVYIALPGGAGTLDELSEVISDVVLAHSNKKIIIYNMDGYYNDLKKQIDKWFDYKLADKNDYINVFFVESLDEISALIK